MQNKYNKHIQSYMKRFAVISTATARETVNPFLQMSRTQPGPIWCDRGHKAAAQQGQRSQQHTRPLTLKPSHQSSTVKTVLCFSTSIPKVFASKYPAFLMHSCKEAFDMIFKGNQHQRSLDTSNTSFFRNMSADHQN